VCLPEQQPERLARTAAEAVTIDGRDNVRMFVDELHDLLQAPHEALQTHHDVLQHLVLALLGLALDVGKHGADGFDDCDDQRAERDGTQVIANRGANGLC